MYYDSKHEPLGDSGIVYASDDAVKLVTADNQFVAGTAQASAYGTAFGVALGQTATGGFAGAVQAYGNVTRVGAGRVTAHGGGVVTGSIGFANVSGLPFNYYVLASPGQWVKWGDSYIFPDGGLISGSATGSVSMSFGGVTTSAGAGGWSNPPQTPTGSEAALGVVVVHFHTLDASPGGAATGASLPLTDMYGGSPALPFEYLSVQGDPLGGGALGFSLLVPVYAGYGTANPVFAGHSIDSSAAAPLAASIAGGYTFTCPETSPSIVGFSIPNALPGGQAEFQISVGGTLLPLSAGAVMDFTQFNSGGVREFALLGIDPQQGFSTAGPPPFVHSFRFAGDGFGQVSAIPLAVPEPSALVLAACGALALLWIVRRSR